MAPMENVVVLTLSPVANYCCCCGDIKLDNLNFKYGDTNNFLKRDEVPSM